MRQLFSVILGMIIVLFFQQDVLCADSNKIAVLDIHRCMNESNEGKRVIQSLKKKHESLQKKLNEKQNELLKLQEDLKKQSMMLSLDAKEDKQGDYERRRREFEYYLQDIDKDMKMASANAQKKVFKDLEGIIKKIAEQGKYNLIFEAGMGGVIYHSDAMDITEEVIKAYNKVKP